MNPYYQDDAVTSEAYCQKCGVVMPSGRGLIGDPCVVCGEGVLLVRPSSANQLSMAMEQLEASVANEERLHDVIGRFNEKWFAIRQILGDIP